MSVGTIIVKHDLPPDYELNEKMRELYDLLGRVNTLRKQIAREDHIKLGKIGLRFPR